VYACAEFKMPAPPSPQIAWTRLGIEQGSSFFLPFTAWLSH
jgi:hypothetical protein